MRTIERRAPRIAIVGGGVAGLAALSALRELAPEIDVQLFERAARVGGLIETEQTSDGFRIDYGADCLLTSKAGAAAALRQGDLAAQAITPAPSARQSFVLARGKLKRLPAGMLFGAPVNPRELFVGGPLSVATKLRLLGEPLVPRATQIDDESVASFVTRRFGRGFLHDLVAPLLEGVHGTSVERLSARACLPELLALERAHGSVARGLALQKSAAPERAPVVSFREGMGALVQAMAAPHRAHVALKREVTRIVPLAGRRYCLEFANGAANAAHHEADGVIVAAPAHAASRMVEPLSPTLASLLASLRYTRLDAVTLAWPRSELTRMPPGSGFVVPASERSRLRAVTFASNKWQGRAPEGFVLMRAVLSGGDLDDPALCTAARRELAPLLAAYTLPELVRARRLERALPIQDVRCLERRERMIREAAAVPHFSLAGNALGLVGVPACIESGREAALALAARVRQWLACPSSSSPIMPRSA